MRHNKVATVVFTALALGLALPVQPAAAAEGAQPQYSRMAPIAEYMIADRDAEIALARSAAPASIADGATVMVLGRRGYTTAVQGKNGFLCYVERSWANTADAPDFWNPKERAPNCFNAAAAKSVAQIYLMKTRLLLAGKSKAEIARTTAAALDSGELPPLAPGAMCYMTSKQQYLNDQAHSWRPHLMFYVAGDVAPSWGANLPGSPMIAVINPELRVTIFMVVMRRWSDGTLAPE